MDNIPPALTETEGGNLTFPDPNPVPDPQPNPVPDPQPNPEPNQEVEEEVFEPGTPDSVHTFPILLEIDSLTDMLPY